LVGLVVYLFVCLFALPVNVVVWCLAGRGLVGSSIFELWIERLGLFLFCSVWVPLERKGRGRLMRVSVGQQLVLGWGQSMLLAVWHEWAHDDVCILSFTYSGLEFGTGRMGCAAGGDTLGITRLVGKGRSREAQSLISRLSNSFVLFTVTSFRPRIQGLV
jgi:hypothetical protein